MTFPVTVKKYKFSEKHYAEQFNCDVRTIRNYKAQGWPLDDPAKMAKMLADRHSDGGKETKADPTLTEAKIKKLMLECERLAFAQQVKRGEYILATEAQHDFTRIAAQVGSELDLIAVEWPTLLFGKNEAAMQKAIREKTRGIRQRLSDMGGDYDTGAKG